MEIAAELRFKHGGLWRLCRELGGTKALADRIGIGHQTVHQWLHMRRCPTPGQYTKWYTQDVERQLEELSGVPAIELFPAELKEATGYFKKNRLEIAIKDVEPSRLEALAIGYEQRMITADPSDQFDRNELREQLEKAMKGLTSRQREVLKLRFIAGMTLEEVGAVFRIHKETVRQIEAAAIRKMQLPSIVLSLKDFVS